MEMYNPIQLLCSEAYTIQGSSKAGFQTGFFVTKLNIMLDAGVYTNKQPRGIYITHSHTDHTTQLPNIITSRSKTTPIYIPECCYIPMQNYLNSIRGLSECMAYECGSNVWKIQKSDPYKKKFGDVFKPNELKNISVEILNCYHTCESIGYGFSSYSMKLKDEYLSLQHDKLLQLKKDGKNIQYMSIIPQFVFFGDTTIDALKKHDEWKKYPVIIIECTGYPDPEPNPDPNIFDFKIDTDNINNFPSNTTYSERGHIHLFDLLPYLKQYQDKQFVLIHSSKQNNEIFLKKMELFLKEKINAKTTICLT